MSNRKNGRASVALAFAAAAVAGCADLNAGPGPASAHETWAFDTGAYDTASIDAGGAQTATQMETTLAVWDGDLDSRGMMAAHPTLPLNSWARVTNAMTGQSAMVRVTRRTAPADGQGVALSRDAAAAIGALHRGPATVLIEPAMELNRAASVQRTFTEVPTRAAPSVQSGYLDYNAELSTGSIPPRSNSFAGQPTHISPGVGYAPTAQAGLAPAARAPSLHAPIAHGQDARSLGGRYLQFGSYRDPRNANQMLRRLEREGLSAGIYGSGFVETAYVNGQVFHRVRVGPVALPDAQRALRDARALGHRDAAIVRP